MGPTAVGKTEAALSLAKTTPLEIISVDSAMIYKGMDIGTAKPSLAERQEVPHHLIDFLDPREPYSAGQFCEDALNAVKTITSCNKLPLMVGGTMMYFNALIFGMADLPDADPDVRSALDSLLKEKGLPHLYHTLQAVDPAACQRIHENDPQRILRALEVYEISGKPLSEHWHNTQSVLKDYRVTCVVLAPKDRSILHARIEKRFDQMLSQGFLDEVKRLRARGDLDLNCPSMRAVGYRQAWMYLNGDMDKATFREKAIVATRQLAKRQLTWLRSWPDAIWFDMETFSVDQLAAVLNSN